LVSPPQPRPATDRKPANTTNVINFFTAEPSFHKTVDPCYPGVPHVRVLGSKPPTSRVCGYLTVTLIVAVASLRSLPVPVSVTV